jgi:hypothetical protein
MPAEFALPLGELLSRVPAHCLWPGEHDAARVLRIPAADVAPGLARGKAEMPLTRLVALAPEIFRWERGDSDAPQVRLPIQKLLQQIRSEEAAFVSPPEQRADDAGAVGGQVPRIILERPAADAISLSAAVPEKAPEFPAHAPAVNLPPPAAQEARPVISVAATEPQGRPVELRPSKDASISTTLRAVVLGGNAPGTPANAPDAAARILAPRIAPGAPATPTVILGPSVVPSANPGGASPAMRIAPDFAGLQNLFMTAAALDLAGVAALAAALPGVRACVITGTAGSATAGDFSHGLSEGEVRAASADPARIGGAATDTLHRGESDIVIFLHDEVCVAAVVAAGGFVPGVRERLARTAELLAGAKPAR